MGVPPYFGFKKLFALPQDLSGRRASEDMAIPVRVLLQELTPESAQSLLVKVVVDRDVDAGAHYLYKVRSSWERGRNLALHFPPRECPNSH